MTIQDNPYNSQLYTFVNTLLERTQEGKINWERTGGRTYRCIGGDNITVISGSDNALLSIPTQSVLTLSFFNRTELLYEYKPGIIPTHLDEKLIELFNLIDKKSCEALSSQFDQFIKIASGDTATVETK